MKELIEALLAAKEAETPSLVREELVRFGITAQGDLAKVTKSLKKLN